MSIELKVSASFIIDEKWDNIDTKCILIHGIRTITTCFLTTTIDLLA
jgi:hypothetical protein